MEYPIVHSNRERAVIFVVDANDGSLQSDAAATRTSLHLLLGLKHQNKKDIQISPAQLLTSLSLSLSSPSCHKLKNSAIACIAAV